jgi:hypothetical protein
VRTKDLLIRTQRVAFQTLANGFKNNRISHAYLISGSIESSLKDMAIFAIESIKSNSFDLSMLDSKLINNGGYIFTSINVVDSLLSSFSDYKLFISFVVVCVVYGFIIISLLTTLISSIVHLIKKNAYKGTSLGLLTISFLIGCLFIYSNIFDDNFANYDSYMIYGFAISFFFWFLVKIIFGKEAKIYKKEKLLKKLNRNKK